MEERILHLQEYFKKDYEEFKKTWEKKSDCSMLVKEEVQEKKKVKDETIPKNQHSLVMNKINKYKKDLEKNNMKKAQKPFVSDGTIEDFEKELGLKPIE